jgi:hypothetical protein
MKLFLFFTGLFLVLTCVGNVSAQYLPGQYTTIFDALQEKQSGKGEVTIDQPLSIKNMVGARQSGRNVETSDGYSFLKTQGYRVQVFSGNNQRTSKDEAFQKEQQIKESFPGLKTYVTYVAPFWRLRVGDYSSHDEAYYTQRRIAEALPSFGKEMYIVREEIQIPLDYYSY